MKVINKTRLLAVNGEQLIVIEKAGDKKLLTLPGGVQKKKESLGQSLARETEEEIGLQINHHCTKHISSSTVIKGKTIVLKHHFLLPTLTNDFKVLEPEKFKAVYWIYWREAINYLDKEDRKAVKKHFKTTLKKRLKLQSYESTISSSITL